jgi:hypothetical protein
LHSALNQAAALHSQSPEGADTGDDATMRSKFASPWSILLARQTFANRDRATLSRIRMAIEAKLIDKIGLRAEADFLAFEGIQG